MLAVHLASRLGIAPFFIRNGRLGVRVLRIGGKCEWLARTQAAFVSSRPGDKKPCFPVAKESAPVDVTQGLRCAVGQTSADESACSRRTAPLVTETRFGSATLATGFNFGAAAMCVCRHLTVRRACGMRSENVTSPRNKRLRYHLPTCGTSARLLASARICHKTYLSSHYKWHAAQMRLKASATLQLSAVCVHPLPMTKLDAEATAAPRGRGTRLPTA